MQFTIGRLQAFALLALATMPSWGQEAWPSRPLRFVVSAPAGSTPDVGARAAGQIMAKTLGQPVVIDNKPGANGLIAAQEVLRNPEDGYTVLVASASTMAINPQIYPQAANLPRELVAVGKVYDVDFYLAARTGIGIDDMAGLLRKARDKPGSVVAAHTGQGSASQMAIEVLKQQAGIDLYQVPFNGSTAAALGVASGNADVLIETQPVTQAFVQSGKMKYLAMTASRRSANHPGVPTLAEVGVPNMAISSWAGIFVRSGVPRDRINKINAALARALAQPDVRSILTNAGLAPGGGSPSDLQQAWQEQSRRWADVVARTPSLKAN
jgi:tripartite-type tricarboxylate transporter receptor subunit TctC